MMRIPVLERCALVSLAMMPSLCLGATARLNDYAQGIAIDVISQRPIVQLNVPDDVYQRVASDQLSDVRVFNADGQPVPHALCTAAQEQAPTISQESLPVYRLQDMQRAAGDDTRVEVQTPGGAQISVQGAKAGDSERQSSAYVIDARGIEDALRAMQFDWSSPDGASEVRVSVQASEDLDRWHTLVSGSTLLSVKSGEQQLRRHRVAIPQARYQYLRLERVDRGPPLQLDGVIAERVTPAPVIEPMWFLANPIASSEAAALQFDAARRAPITYARLVLSQDNTSLRVAIESRDEDQASWSVRWSGEAYSILTDTERRVSPPAEFAATAARLWRVRLTNQGETFTQTPALELGYRAAQLRFLAQGEGPFTLAFASRRAEAAPTRGCDSLLADMSAQDLAQNLGEGIAGVSKTLGGEDALRPLPKQTPVRQIVLWGVLVLGVGALVAMALSLLRRVNADGKR
jgi:hypothetical protein